MEVGERKLDGAMVVTPRGSLDSNTSRQFEERLFSLIRQGDNRLIIDLEDVDYISSAGLRVIIKAVKELKQGEGQLILCSMKDYIRELFELSGFASFLPIYPSLEESIQSLD